MYRLRQVVVLQSDSFTLPFYNLVGLQYPGELVRLISDREEDFVKMPHEIEREVDEAVGRLCVGDSDFID